MGDHVARVTLPDAPSGSISAAPRVNESGPVAEGVATPHKAKRVRKRRPKVTKEKPPLDDALGDAEALTVDEAPAAAAGADAASSDGAAAVVMPATALSPAIAMELTRAVYNVVGLVTELPPPPRHGAHGSGSIELTLPSRKERVRADLERAFRKWGRALSTCSLHPFGSSVTGLAFDSSDVDLNLVAPRCPAKKAIYAMLNVVRRDSRFDSVIALTHTRVPILKLRHTNTEVECDITVNRELSRHNSALLKMYCHIDDRVRPLILAVKYWTKQRKVYDASAGLLSSYAWVLSVLFYLQQPIFQDGGGGEPAPLLPNLQCVKLVQAARRVETGAVISPGAGPTIVDGCDTSFCHRLDVIHAKHPPSSLLGGSIGELLAGFFAFYAVEFDWASDVVAIGRSGCLKKMDSEFANQAQLTRLSIEDPYDHDHDLARGLIRSKWQLIRGEVSQAHRTIEKHSRERSEGDGCSDLERDAVKVNWALDRGVFVAICEAPAPEQSTAVSASRSRSRGRNAKAVPPGKDPPRGDPSPAVNDQPITVVEPQLEENPLPHTLRCPTCKDFTTSRWFLMVRHFQSAKCPHKVPGQCKDGTSEE